MRTSLLGELHAVAFFHDNTRHLSGYFNYFINSDSALVSVIALVTPVGLSLEDLETGIDIVLCKAFCQ